MSADKRAEVTNEQLFETLKGIQATLSKIGDDMHEVKERLGILETQVAVLMGGRVAEELFMNHMTSGASNDIERATDIAQHMVCEFGMSELGPLAFRKPGHAFDSDRAHVISEATAQRVDEAIRTVVMDAYEKARGIIDRNRSAVQLMAVALLDQESLDAHEIAAIMDKSGALVVR